ncbi:Glycosyl transferase, family 3 [Paracidovorax avenae ATCC 19860]|uniref:Glycosyl transferase, family 3 n=1 Tax=Paracidovorax avenae (strain ATCC 19860 / DSM 7227 / CCUG 15838 / JCM 20985 / LMG 2117 / NCPPB 1011) TaxID=643561 RepID=F0Q6K6_PARA1|nr:DNA-binding protein YbiB [Paracidovorax avenae]ADX46952.1 Glycosyl transferase, family 3 [Paracidovorax avenae ATCC 19860]
MGSISHYLKDLGRGARGARAIGREQAADLFGQVLDGQVTDYEVGAFCIAMRIKGETADEMCGFLDATHARLAPVPAGDVPTIVLPSYNGARRLPVLTPLLALLLAREGLPVLLHGMRTEARRVLASDVLQALGVAPMESPEAVAPGSVAHVRTGLLCPGLARLLAVREVVGLRNPGHSVVKLMNPVRGPSLLVTAYTHPEYLEMLHATFAARGMDVLLSRGLEGEVAADPRRTPRYDAFVRGAHHVWDEQQPGTAAEVPGLPADIDVDSTARYTQQVLAGELPVPAPLSRQVEHILRLARQNPTETAP